MAQSEEDKNLYEEYITYKKMILVSVLRISYTQIFGIYSGFVYVMTGSVWPAVALHAQCNFFGLPSFANIKNEDIRRTERMLLIILYLCGIVIVFTCFTWFTKPVEGDVLPFWQDLW